MITDAPVQTFCGRIANRRLRPRIVVQWPLYVWRGHEHLFDTVTMNVSSGGFYCLCTEPFSPGENLTAVLEMPGHGTDQQSGKLILRCDIVVLRVETVIDNRSYGVACRIRDFSVLRPAPPTLEYDLFIESALLSRQEIQNGALSEKD